MNPSTRVAILAIGAFLPSFLVGLWIADEFVNMELLQRGDRTVHILLGVVAGALGSTAAAVSTSQQQSVRRDGWGLQSHLRWPQLAPVMAFFGSPLIVVATILPFARSGRTEYRLLDFSNPANYWLGAALGNWVIAAVAFWVAVRLLLSDSVDRRLVALLLGLGLAMFTGFLGLAIQFWASLSIGTSIGLLGSALVLLTALVMLGTHEG